MSFNILNKHGSYRDKTNDLLKVFKVNASEGSVEALAKRIMFTAKGIAQKVHTRQLTPRLTETVDSATAHTDTLLRYSAKPPSRYSSVYDRQKKLVSVLDDLDLIFELEFAKPPTNVSSLVRAISDSHVSTNSLENLRRSLTFVSAKPRKRTGRPKDYKAFIINSVVQVWLSAGKEFEFTYNCGEFTGDFPNFLLDVFRLSEIPELNGDELDALNQRISSKELDKMITFLKCNNHSK